jgi:hypothetical protein
MFEPSGSAHGARGNRVSRLTGAFWPSWRIVVKIGEQKVQPTGKHGLFGRSSVLQFISSSRLTSHDLHTFVPGFTALDGARSVCGADMLGVGVGCSFAKSELDARCRGRRRSVLFF